MAQDKQLSTGGPKGGPKGQTPSESSLAKSQPEEQKAVGLSIKHKYSLVIVATCVTAIMVTALSFFQLERQQLRQAMVQELVVFSKVLGGVTAPSLTFDDAVAVEESLGPLQADPSILEVCVYDTSLFGDVGLLAGYQKDGVAISCPDAPGVDREEFLGDRLVLVRMIQLFGEDLGTLYIIKDASAIELRLAEYTRAGVLIVVAAILISMLIASVAQRWVVGPVLSLAGAVSRATTTKEGWSYRGRRSQDEIGLLADQFSSLFRQIEQDDAALAAVRAELTEKVEAQQDADQDSEQADARLEQLESKLLDREKDASVGQLASGVAKEIESPIGIGVTATSTLHEKAKGILEQYQGGKLKRTSLEKFINHAVQSSDIILSNLSRAADMVGSFKQVAEDQSSGRQRSINVHEYFSGVVSSLKPRVTKLHHEIELDCDTQLVVATVPGAFSQIINNLVMNSLFHAYDDGQNGLIRIAAKLVGDELEVIYSDDGKGMSPKALETIFDPIFTARTGSGANGIGMYSIHRLVTKTLGGTITAQSRQGAGMTFRISVPVSLVKEDVNDG